MKKISILLFCFIMAFSFVVPAQSTEYLDVSVNSKTAEVKISGQFNSKKELMSVRILPKSIDETNITVNDIITNKYVMKTIRTDEIGKYGENIILPDIYSGGIYTVYVNIGSNKFSKDITYINYSKVKSFVDKLNLQTSKDNFISSFSDTDIAYPNKNYTVLVLSDTDYSLFGDNIAENLYYSKPNGNYDTDGFINEYSKVYFVNKQNTSFSEDRVKEYALYFNLDYENEYKNMTSESKTAFISNLKSNYSNNKAANTVFWDSLILAKISTSATYVELKDVFLNYSGYISADMTKYNTLNEYNQNNVFSQIYSQKGNIASISDLKTAFENASATYTQIVLIPSGGGGASGGSYSDNFNIAPDVSQTKSEFTDMKNHWSSDYVYSLSKKGVISGFSDGSFRPDNNITRAELIKLVVVMFDLDVDNMNCFSDVNTLEWYSPYVYTAYKNGITNGDNGMFYPNNNITRQDMATLIYRALNKKITTNGEDTAFSDSDAISDYAKEAVKSLSKAGIITGYNNMFNPLGTATRAEAATMLCRILSILEGVQ